MDQTMTVDIRVIVGQPHGDAPIMLPCRFHNDPNASMEVRADHIYCHGCRKFVRRYASVALLTGVWDGRPETELAAVFEVRNSGVMLNLPKAMPVEARPPKPLDLSAPASFNRYLLSDKDTLAYFMAWRGITEQSIEGYCLGYTGTHFSLPVYSLSGTLQGIRFRLDPRRDREGRKYGGVTGSNAAGLYSLRHVTDIQDDGRVWVVEGEYDTIVARQLGLPAITITNGAGQLDLLPNLLRACGLYPSKWVIATDQDEAGEQAAWGLHKVLGSAAVRARWPDGYKDISEFALIGGGAGDIKLDSFST